MAGPTINTHPITHSVAIDGTLTLTVTATAEAGTLSYQWYFGAAPVGTNSDTLTITPYANTNRGSYTVDVTDDAGTTSSDAAVITTAPAITVQPSATNVIIDGALELSVTATGYETSYQWMKGILPVVDATLSTLTIDPYTDDDRGTYSVVVTSDTENLESDPVLVKTMPEITVQPVADAAQVGGIAELTVTATGHLVSYQWKHGLTNVGTDSDTLTINPYSDSDSGLYTVTVTSDGLLATSNSAAITTLPGITTQPLTQAVVLGVGVVLSVVATGDSHITYQWTKEDVPIEFSSTNSEYSIPSFSNTDRGSYKCIVTCGGVDLASDAAVLTTQAAIITQPVATKCKIGDQLRLFVQATGYNVTYQWKKGVDNVGTSSYEYIIPTYADVNRGAYTVDVISDGTTVVSSSITVSTDPKITVQPVSHGVVETEEMVLSVTATGHPTITYQWKKGGSPIGLATESSYTIASYADANRGSYTVDVICDGNTVTSNAGVITTIPTIITQPEAFGGVIGDDAGTLVVASPAARCTYEWFHDLVSTGMHDATLTISPYSNSSRGEYYVVVTCDGSSAESNNVLATTLPDVVSQSVTHGCELYLPVTLFVEATGYEQTYQWYLDREELVGETEPTLLIASTAGSSISTSITTMTIATGAHTLVVASGLGLAVGCPILISEIVDPGSKNMVGTVVAYDDAFGDLVVDITSKSGSGEFSLWTLKIIGFAEVDKGTYKVEVTSEGEMVASSDIVLSVKPTITSRPAVEVLSIGDAVEFSVTAIGI